MKFHLRLQKMMVCRYQSCFLSIKLLIKIAIVVTVDNCLCAGETYTDSYTYDIYS